MAFIVEKCMKRFDLSKFVLLMSFLTLSACGGGGGSSGSNSNNEPTYTVGVYEDPSLFKNRCAAPRTDNDINGDPYPDVAGSVLTENHWLRSWKNDTYLWYDELPDINPANSNNPIDYFTLLRTSELTPSGLSKGRFDFTRDTSDAEQLRQSGSSVSYGIDWLINNNSPRQIYMRFIEPGSAAAEASLNLVRGTRVIEVDGVNVTTNTQTGIDALNAGLFPSEDGESHDFLIEEVGTGTRRTVSIVAEVVSANPVPTTNVFDTATGRVGYMLFNTFGTFIAESALIDAMEAFEDANVDDLIIDLRYNGGGFGYIAAQLGYMVAGTDATNGKIFDLIKFNDKYPTTNPVTGGAIEPTPFYRNASGRLDGYPSSLELPALNLNRVFILSTSGTCSASEALINALNGIDIEVIQIGTTTCGKPVGFYATDNCGTTYYSVQLQLVNDKGFGDYFDGFSPVNDPFGFGVTQNGCYVVDNITSILGDSSDPLISAALDYSVSGTCPPITKSLQPQPHVEGELGLQERRIRQMMLLNDPFKEE